MKIQSVVKWISIAFAFVYGLIVTGFGIWLAVRGQDCLSYNDYACAFEAMFSFIIIPLGLIVLVSTGLAALPFKLPKLLGGIFSILIGLTVVGIFCLFSLYVIMPESDNLIGSSLALPLLLTLMQFIGAAALITAGGLAIWDLRKIPGQGS